MLRITVADEPGALTFHLEGRLAGPWVRGLEECWQSALARQRQPVLREGGVGVAQLLANVAAQLVQDGPVVPAAGADLILGWDSGVVKSPRSRASLAAAFTVAKTDARDTDAGHGTRPADHVLDRADQDERYGRFACG
jgi:hypothetical protein